MKNTLKISIIKYFFITLGSLLYAAGTVFFIFPYSVLLGGTSGISVILNEFLPFSPGKILVVINIGLLVMAFVMLGKQMAVDTFIGSSLTTFFIGILENTYINSLLTEVNVIICAAMGAVIIALSSGILFFFKSSSGGTDIVALVVKKYSNLNIGRCLLITDFVIVAVGGMVLGVKLAVISFAAFLIKTFGIDIVVGQIEKIITLKKGLQND